MSNTLFLHFPQMNLKTDLLLQLSLLAFKTINHSTQQTQLSYSREENLGFGKSKSQSLRSSSIILTAVSLYQGFSILWAPIQKGKEIPYS